MTTLRAIERWDQKVFLQAQQSLFMRQWAFWLSKSADGPSYLVVVAVCGLTGWLSNGQVLQLCLLISVERILYFVLKNGLKRRRPPEVFPGFKSLIVPSDHFSLPSGHTSGAALFALFFSLQWPILSPILCVWTVLVGCSRVALGVHFPIDIIAGACLGMTTTWVLLGVMA